MKTIIAGSRSIHGLGCILDAIRESGFNITEVVSGGANGVDKNGEWWAKHVGNVPIKQFIPDWIGIGKAAGVLRNRDMADYADALILIWDGKSRGSDSMLRYAIEKGIPVFEYISTPNGWGSRRHDPKISQEQQLTEMIIHRYIYGT